MPVLQIRDKDGKLVPIPCIKGERGKSAYEYLKDNGYKGTEEQFIALLNGVTAGEDSDHYADFDNPHRVTAQQTGALPLGGGTLTGQSLFLNDGMGRLESGNSYVQIDVFDSPKDGQNRRKIVLNGKNSDVPFSDSLTLVSVENGVQTTAKIYGEHNKPTAEDVGALSNTGGTVEGAIVIDSPEGWGQIVMHSLAGNYRCVEADDIKIRLDARDTTKSSDRRCLDVFSKAGKDDLSNAIRLSETVGGAETVYPVLHTGNINSFVISKGSYKGGGARSKTIPVRKTTQMVIVYGMSPTGTPYTLGVLVRGMTKTYSDISAVASGVLSDVAWADTTVTISANESSEVHSWNVSDFTYHYVVIG